MPKSHAKDTPHANSAPIAAVYARVSTTDQADRGYSLPTQVEACQAMAQQEGYTVPESYTFVDDYTGTSLNRPQFTELRDLVRQRMISAIFAYDLDRLSRKLAHQLLLDEEFEQAGVTLRIVTMPQGDKSPEGQLMAHVKGVIAEYERTKILERTKRGRLGRAKAGHVPYGRRSYGYRYVKDPVGAHYEVDLDESAVVQRIFTMYIAGMSQEAIAAKLTAEGIPSPKHEYRRLPIRVWHQSAVKIILRSETYVGVKYDNKTRNIPGKADPDRKTNHEQRPKDEWIAVEVPAIIDQQTWNTVQALRPQRQRESTRNRKYAYLLINGRLRCGQCGGAMTPEQSPGRQARYRCTASKRHYAVPHTRQSVMANQVEPEVWQKVERVLNNPGLIAKELTRQQEQSGEMAERTNRDRVNYQRQLVRIDREAQKLWEAYVNDAVTVETFKARNADLETRKQHIETDLAALDAAEQQMQASVTRLAGLRDYCAHVRAQLREFTMEGRRLAIEALDVRAVSTPGEPLAITCAIPQGIASDLTR
jgi:site-specific DNA recombinase